MSSKRHIGEQGDTTVLVTGGSGFVGSAVVRSLLESGYRVRALVRPHCNLSNLQGLDIELVEGDLNEPETLVLAIAGCRGLFHVAADYRLWVRDPEQMYKTNVDGTRYLMQTALDCNLERIVYTSSVATLGKPENGLPADENTPVSLEDMVSHYKLSKYIAEQVVRQMVRTKNLPAIIVHPSTPVGAGDIKPTPTGRIIADAVAGRIPAFVDTGLNIVDVRDVACGHVLAYEYGRIGEGYVIGGENMSLQEILIHVAHLTGRRPPRIRLPRTLLFPLAWISEFWARWVPNAPEPLLTVDGLRMSGKKMYFSSKKAEQELGYRHRPGNEALSYAVHWFRNQHQHQAQSTATKAGQTPSWK